MSSSPPNVIDHKLYGYESQLDHLKADSLLKQLK